MDNSQKPVARREGLVIQEMPEEVLVYDLETNKAHCLNQTAAFVWKTCDGQHTVKDITRLFGDEAGATIHEDLIWLAIDQLNENNLLAGEIKVGFKNQTRREVIKKVGLAAVVALPLVASLTAPTAARAAACSGVVTNCTPCNDGQPCRTAGGAAGTCQGGACAPNLVKGANKKG